MDYAESLERAHRSNGRATNIYVENPYRPGVGTLQPSPDPGPSRKVHSNNYPLPDGPVFTTAIGIRQLPEDEALKAFVFSSSASASSQRATDFSCAATICYQTPSQDLNTLTRQTERLRLSTTECSPCCPAHHHDALPHEPTVATRFLQPPFESLPSRTDVKPTGHRTPSEDQQRRDDLDADGGGGVIRKKCYGQRTVVICSEDQVCPRCGKPRKGDVDEEEWVEGGPRAGYRTSRVVDAVSCLCCVKAVFYHCCSEEDDDTHCSDAPCSCTGRPLCCPRWTCLLLAGVTCLPCLLLYWPIRLLLRLVARCRRRGLCSGGGSCSCAKAREGYDACAFRKF